MHIFLPVEFFLVFDLLPAESFLMLGSVDSERRKEEVGLVVQVLVLLEDEQALLESNVELENLAFEVESEALGTGAEVG